MYFKMSLYYLDIYGVDGPRKFPNHSQLNKLIWYYHISLLRGKYATGRAQHEEQAFNGTARFFCIFIDYRGYHRKGVAIYNAT